MSARRKLQRKKSKPLQLRAGQRELLANAFARWKQSMAVTADARARLEEVAGAIVGAQWHLKELDNGDLELYDHDYKATGG